MKGLLIKDFYITKNTFKNYISMFLVFILLSIVQKDLSYIVTLTVVIPTSQIMANMSYDDMSNWNGYGLTMPISRKDLVLSKYIFSFILSLLVFFLSLVINIFLLKVTNISSDSIVDIIIYQVGTMVSNLLVISILLPLLIKDGVNKARINLFITFAIIGLGLILIIKVFKFNIYINNNKLLVALLGLGMILTIYFSIKISIYYMDKKDF